MHPLVASWSISQFLLCSFSVPLCFKVYSDKSRLVMCSAFAAIEPIHFYVLSSTKKLTCTVPSWARSLCCPFALNPFLLKMCSFIAALWWYLDMSSCWELFFFFWWWELERPHNHRPWIKWPKFYCCNFWESWCLLSSRGCPVSPDLNWSTLENSTAVGPGQAFQKTHNFCLWGYYVSTLASFLLQLVLYC